MPSPDKQGYYGEDQNMTVELRKGVTRKTAWQSVGSWIQTPEHDGLTASDIITQAGLDWTVAKTELTTTVLGADGVHTMPLEDKVAVTRMDKDYRPIDILGVVGKDYSPVQNGDMVALLDGIVDGAGASFEAAGAYRSNKSVFVAMRLPFGFTVGDDQSDVYLFVENSHDGGGALNVSVTGVRLACTNQIKGIRKANGYSVSFRHTKNMNVTGQRVREAINLTVQATKQLSEEAEALISSPFSKSEYQELIKTLLPLDGDLTDRVTTSREEARGQLMSVWSSPTNAGIVDTRWGAWNAISEYDQWYRPVRGAQRSVRQLENRLKGDTLTEKAGKLLLAGV